MATTAASTTPAPTRLDSIADLESFFDRFDGPDDASGEWVFRNSVHHPKFRKHRSECTNSRLPLRLLREFWQEVQYARTTFYPGQGLTVNTATMARLDRLGTQSFPCVPPSPDPSHSV